MSERVLTGEPSISRESPASVAPPERRPRTETSSPPSAGRDRLFRLLISRNWQRYAAGLVVGIYLLVFVRGLGWQWAGIISASRTTPPVAVGPTAPEVPARGVPPVAVARASGDPAARAKVPLPPTDEPPPRNAVDRYGVQYDEHGVAVLGIDADPSGVYNVPAGRQLRIGGPTGQLYDVLPGGRITPATQIKEWPR